LVDKIVREGASFPVLLTDHPKNSDWQSVEGSKTPKPTFQFAVAVAIRRADGRHLLIRRAAGIKAAGYWTPVTGRVEENESFQDAARREVWEEIGLKIEVFHEVYRCQAVGAPFWLVWLDASVNREQLSEKLRLCAEEVADYRWVTKEQALEMAPMFPETRRFYEEIASFSARTPSENSSFEELIPFAHNLHQQLAERHPELPVLDRDQLVKILLYRLFLARFCDSQQASTSDTNLTTLFPHTSSFGVNEWLSHLTQRFPLPVQQLVPTTLGTFQIKREELWPIADYLWHTKRSHQWRQSIDILGHFYEFLVSEAGQRSANEPHDNKRKLDGVFYTPSLVVKEMIETCFRVWKQDEFAQQRPPRVLDPACGCGSFLIAAFDYLLSDKQSKQASPLTLTDRLSLLETSIFGVDIDPQALEVTKHTLLLRALQGNLDTVDTNQLTNFFHRWNSNFGHGNSLLCSHHGDLQKPLGQEGEFLPVNWQARFPEVFAEGGFDMVVGNPPYLSYGGRQHVVIDEKLRKHYKKHYACWKGWPTGHTLFIERSLRLLSRRLVSFLVPDQVGHLRGYQQCRAFLTEHAGLRETRYWGENVFQQATTPALSFLADKLYQGELVIHERNGTIHQGVLPKHGRWSLAKQDDILQQLLENSHSLGDLVADAGVRTRHSPSQIVPLVQRNDDIEQFPILEGKLITRYGCAPPTKAIRFIEHEGRGVLRRKDPTYQRTRYLIRQTASYPIVGPRDYALYYRNSLLALFEPKDHLDIKYLVGLLNSKVLRYVYCLSVREAQQRAFPQVKIQYLRELPIRNIVPDDPRSVQFHDNIVSLVDSILRLNHMMHMASEADKKQISTFIQTIDQAIDDQVYSLYQLNDTQIAHIESFLKKSYG
jgi:8-oxo-dGTP pyrophosphatase MutT (NUDIX family)/methylase of polypeptide subunit release factors